MMPRIMCLTLLSNAVHSRDLFLARPKSTLAQCTLEPNTDYIGVGVDFANTPADSVDVCCAACAANSACVVGVLYEGVCYLKNTAGSMVSPTSSPGRIAVVLRSGPTPAPPSPPSPSTPMPPMPAPAQCTDLPDTDFVGGDYANAPADSVDACCAACTADSTCVGAVLYEGTCYRKNNIAIANSSKGRVAVIAGSVPTPAPPTPPTPPPTPLPPTPGSKIEWRVVRGNATKDPELLLNVGEGFKPFQLRGVDYSPIAKCCGNNDASAFYKPFWKRDVPRMAAAGINVIKLYGMCDGTLDNSNYCQAPESGCERTTVTQSDVFELLDFCYEHRVFVLLANRNKPGNLEAYDHMSKTYASHPAVAGIIMYDEALDTENFNAASKKVHENICSSLGKDPAATPVEENGRIITTAAQSQILDPEFHVAHGLYINVWGFDPYSQWSYTDWHDFSVPFKPFMITENGIQGAANAGCRTDCVTDCSKCSDFAAPWKQYVKWMETARLAGHIIFEWTDENWKGGRDPCNEVHSWADGNFNEANHGLFHVSDDNSLVSKSIGDNETFESVLKASWTQAGVGEGGFYGWL